MPGVFLVFYAMRIRARVPDSGRDPMLLGLWMNVVAMAIFAAGFLFFAAAIWWLLRRGTVGALWRLLRTRPAARRCPRCGAGLEAD